MRCSLTSALWVVFGLFTVVSARDVLGILSPCPDCPKSIAPPRITVTSQYQAVSTCKPKTVWTTLPMITPITTLPGSTEYATTTTSSWHLEPSCSTYDWVSTSVPCLDGASTSLITKTDQILDLSHVSTVLTSYLPCSTTAAPVPSHFANGTYPIHQNASSCTSTKYQTMIVDEWAPYDDVGPLAFPDIWEGSGLCTECLPKPNETLQVVTVSKCLDASCSVYTETWILEKTSSTVVPSECPTPVATSAYITSNGDHTIPITKTYTPTGSGFSTPVTTTIFYTTSVSDTPRVVECTTTITVTFVESFCPIQTVVSGSTYKPTAPAIIPAKPTGTARHGDGSHSLGGVSYTTSTISANSSPKGAHGPSKTGENPSYSHYPTSTLEPQVHPTSPPIAGTCDFVGCFGSEDGFQGFILVENSAKMSIEVCTNECLSSGFPYSGLHKSECYCAAALDEKCGADKANGICDIACPGNPAEACGGHGLSCKKLKRSAPILLDVYECPVLTTTTSATETSTTSSGLPDKSSDPEPAPEPRSLEANIDTTLESIHDVKLRRGGVLSSPRRPNPAVTIKRDLSLKKPFGL